ncbi:hypothetical protein MHYP_G00023520 [Metynnis hypsauchen]
MKVMMVLGFLCVCVLIAVGYQAFQQEFTIRRLRSQITSTTEQVKAKEDEIVKAKLKIQHLNDELTPLNKKRDELVKKKEEFTKASGESEKSLNTCQKEKTDSEKKKTEATEALEKQKIDHKAEEEKTQVEVQNLQKQILDRDAKICEFVDTDKEEGRKLCEGKKAAR